MRKKRSLTATDQRPATDIVKPFEELSDSRTGNAKTYIFLEILIIAVFQKMKAKFAKITLLKIWQSFVILL